MYYTGDECTLCMQCIEQCPTNAIQKLDRKAFNCVTCGRCAEVCPTKAISLNQYGGYVVDKDLCTGCGICAKNCPFGFISFIDEKSVGICSMCGNCCEICPTGAKMDVSARLRYDVDNKTFVEIEKPEPKKKKEEVSKSSIYIDRDLCTNCGKCRNACPAGAIELDSTWGICTDCKLCEENCPTKAITLPDVNGKKCIKCYKCVRDCPVGAISFEDGMIKIHTGDANSHVRYCVNCSNCVDVCHYGALTKKGLRISYEADKCTDCGLCLLVCPYDMRRVENDVYTGHCILCGRCVKACPENAIKLKKTKWKGDVNDNCVHCGLCMELCPKQCIYVDKDRFEVDLDRCDLCGVCAMACQFDAITFDAFDKIQITGGSVEYDPSLCVKCMQCVSLCPTQAISSDMEWDMDKCIYCGACDNICPGHAVRVRTCIGDMCIDGRRKEVRK